MNNKFINIYKYIFINKHIMPKNNSDAYFIDSEEECNICSNSCPEKTKMITLKCNPKHIFCEECITDWYVEIKNSKSKHNNYPTGNMCPICKKIGGLLPCSENVNPIKGIHIMNSDIQTVCYFQNTCNAKLKSKNGYCKNKGNPHFGGFCKTHKNSQNPSDSTTSTQNNDIIPFFPFSIDEPINGLSDDTTISEPPIPTIQNSHICNSKFKTKDGFCKNVGQSKYGWKCGFHKPTA